MNIASLYPCPFDIQDRHDFNAAILSGDRVYSYEEDKLTTVKNEGTVKYAERSLMMGLKELNILPSEIDTWVFPKPSREVPEDDFFLFFSWMIKAYLGSREDFADWFKKTVHFVPHHISHVSIAVHGSDFDKCAFISQDGGGDFGDPRHFVFGEYENGEYKELRSGSGRSNICAYHSFVTDSLGFAGNDNGKTSGLAAYGSYKEDLARTIKDFFVINDDGIQFKRQRFGRTKVNLAKVNITKYNRTKIFSQFPSDNNVLRPALSYLPHDIAHTGEKIMSDTFLEYLKILKNETLMTKAIFTGGLFQNVALNNKILESKIFDEVYFPMASGDSGLALGAAFYVKEKLGEKVRERKSLMSTYIGPSFSNDEILELIESYRMPFKKIDDIPDTVARLIADGKIIGWFQGRAEFGPRSLGARSICADPRNMMSKLKINQLLKKRDWFMPYAPSMLEEEIGDWLEIPVESPYMQVAFKLRSEKSSLIPAAVHVDGSTRVHTVSKKTNPLYWEMINKFKEKTGVPLVLNTSFNRHGIATISTPYQAIHHLLEGCMDYLCIGDYLISFDDVRKVSRDVGEPKPEENCLKEDCVRRLEVFNKFNDEQALKTYVEELKPVLGLDDLNYADGKIQLNGKAFAINDAVKELYQYC